MTHEAASVISDILSELMFDKKIKMIDLTHQTGVPQSTLSRILSGETTHPHRSSLEPLANFFQISINQLLGNEPIPSHKRLRSFLNRMPTVPLLSWEQITPWLTLNSNFTTQEILQVDVPLEEGSFAVTVNDASMEPQFPRGTILVIDPNKTAKDRNFVIATLGDCQKVIFRQLLTDGIHRYLRPLSPEFTQFGMKTLSDEDKILGVVLQARKNYLD